MTSVLPDGRKAICVVVHGIAEHSGRYAHVAERLASEGYGVYRFDLRGHGRAAGFPGLVAGPDDWLDDLSAVAERARRENPRLPLFLIGHSMGTFVALAFSAERARTFAGMVLSGIAVAPGPATLESLADPDAPGIPPEALSHDEQVVRAYAEDPLVFNERVPEATTVAAVLCSQRAFEGASRVDIPVLIVHGGADRIADVSGAHEVHEVLGSKDKRVVVYDGLLHEVFNETDRDRVLADVVAWLDAHVGAGAG